MIANPPSPTRVIAGAGCVVDTLRAAPPPTPAVVLVDAGTNAAMGGQLAATIGAAASADRILCLCGPSSTLADVTALAGELGYARSVVAVGGGSLLDVVKLACAGTDDAWAPSTRHRRGRSGLVVLPKPVGSRPHRVLVPTTLGTGSEVSAAACVGDETGKRLVLGEALRPELALLDPVMTRTLPRHLLAEGILEALLRVLGPYATLAPAVGVAALPMHDSLAVWLAGELAAVGDRLAGGESGDALRTSAAQLSAYTHIGWASSGRDPFGWKLWYVANELATTLGVRKMQATVALAPEYFRRVASDARYGSRARLWQAWRSIRTRLPSAIDPDPVAGIPELLSRWGLESQVRVDRRQLDAVARRADRVWGAGLPMLAPLRVDDVRSLLDAALAPDAHAASRAAGRVPGSAAGRCQRATAVSLTAADGP